MSAFKQKLARLGATAGVLAASSAAIFAVGGATASSALATPTCPGSPTKSGIEGQGSSLQKIAQEVWTGRVAPSNPTTWPTLPHALRTLKTGETSGYAETCGEAPSVNYTSTGSGAGLKSLGYRGGVVQNGENGEPTMSFAGTDEAPIASEITTAETAAHGAKAVIIPVAQTAIAVIVHPPANCTFNNTSSTKGISYAELNEIFSGTLKEWGKVAAASGTGCSGSAITRVVREDGSGTTYQFKNYLSELETTTGIKAPGPGCSSETGASTWKELRPIGTTTTAPNTVWPKCESRSTVVAKNGGGGVAAYVASTEGAGSIGYAALPDAKNNSAQVARLQNTVGTSVYALPESGESANCSSRSYTVPVGGREGETALSVNWSEVFGAKPNIQNAFYPLCTLTYDLAWDGYETAKYSTPTLRAEQVKAYIAYILNEGQSIGHYYQALPQPGAGHVENNVLGAAKAAAANIS